MITENRMDYDFGGENCPPFIIIKVNQEWEDKRTDLYDNVRRDWRISDRNADPNRYPYVLAVKNKIVLMVYKVDHWEQSKDVPDKKVFVGEEAPKEIQDLFVGKHIPAIYCRRGMSNPLLFSK